MIRTRAARIADSLAAFDRERDCWVATGRGDGEAHLIPLSFCWDGEQFVIATREDAVTVSSLRRSNRVRISLPSTDDVVIIEATARIVSSSEIDATTHHQFCMVAGFDPCVEPEPYVFGLLTPVRIQAWRNVAELADRVIMRGGAWLSDPALVTEENDGEG
ncbi:MAG: pyridoxamine 5'-phosphate oxidase family protein [Thermomicrobiales bacterium]